MSPYRTFTCVAALLTFVGAFLLFLSDTHEVFGSLGAALLSAGLVWISCVMLGWLCDVFIKPKN